jgi:hypothetical protein
MKPAVANTISCIFALVGSCGLSGFSVANTLQISQTTASMLLHHGSLSVLLH